MPKRKDENEIAFDALQQVIRRDVIRNGLTPEPIPEPKKLDYRVKAGTKGGLKGGPARAKKLSAKKRKAIAKKAAKARWPKDEANH